MRGMIRMVRKAGMAACEGIKVGVKVGVKFGA